MEMLYRFNVTTETLGQFGIEIGIWDLIIDADDPVEQLKAVMLLRDAAGEA